MIFCLTQKLGFNTFVNLSKLVLMVGEKIMIRKTDPVGARE